MDESFQIVEDCLVGLVEHSLWVFLKLILLNNKFSILSSYENLISLCYQSIAYQDNIRRNKLISIL